MSLSEGIVDFWNGPSTNGYLDAGNPVTGTNSDSADADGFNVYLQGGVTYHFYIDGITYPSGVGNHLAYLNLYSPSGLLVGQSAGDSYETLTFTPWDSGFYGASVQTGGGAGSYFLTYDAISVSDDFDAAFSSSPFLVGNGPTFGQLNFAGDCDGFQFSTQAGQRYYFEYYTTVPDLYVQVQDWSYNGLPGAVVSGGGSGSFIAETTDDVLLLVSSNSFTTTGTYYLYAAPTFTTTANLVMGGALDDTLVGTIGSDEIHGSWGQDSLSGGEGDDYLFGGPSNDADTLDGGSGIDMMAGGTGNDIYVVDNTSDAVVELTGEGTDSVESSASFTLGADVERLALSGSTAINGTGNTLANTLSGNAAANSLNGSSGNDTISGGAGDDVLTGSTGSDSLVGGTGNDIYVIDSVSDLINEATTTASEIDTVQSSVSLTLGANLERLILIGTAVINGVGNTLANTLTGNAAANSLNGSSGNDTISGGAGNDVLTGSTGNDSLIGGTGNDTYFIDSVSDLISETTTTASEIDAVQSSVSWTLGANLERLTLTGSAVINGVGNTLANTLTGNAAANSLNGSSGNDTISGGAGNDVLTGSTGNDSLVGGTGNDTYFIDSVSDLISETTTTASEIDTVQSSVSWTLGANLERLTLTGSAVTSGVGNTLDNTLIGNSAANSLNGSSGNDTLNGGTGNDTLIGGAGNDSLVGGSGNDYFRFTSSLSASSNVDRLSDFSSVYDALQLDDAVFKGIGSVGTLNVAAFRVGSSAGDSNDRVIYNSATGSLYFDSDGSGSGEAVLFATVTPNTSITAADLFVV